MLVMAGNGIGRALGSAFGAGAYPYKYTCGSTICYGSDGSGVAHAHFKEFQYQLNRVGSMLAPSNWKPISVDGFIGKNTLSAYATLALAAKAVPAGPVGALNNFGGVPSSFQALSKLVAEQSVVEALTSVGNAVTGKTESPVTVSDRAAVAAQDGKGQTPSAPPPASKVGKAPAAGSLIPVNSLVPVKSSKVGIIVGVTAALAAIGLIGIAVSQSKRKHAHA